MITVATTLTTFAMASEDTWGSWLINAEAIQASHPDGVSYFCAIETDARGLEPFGPLIDRMREVGGSQWTFHLDDGRQSVTTANRLRHITVGQNLCTDAALSAGATHLLFLAADLEPPPDCLPKLLEVDHPLVGGHVPTYCLDGPTVGHWYDRFPEAGESWGTGEAELPAVREHGMARFGGDVAVPADADVRVHMATAAFVLIRRDLLRYVRWRWDLDAGMSDDPCLHHDARTFHGVETLVRHDVIGRHHPEAIGAIETRFPGVDMGVYRDVEGGAPDPDWVDHHAAGR